VFQGRIKLEESEDKMKSQRVLIALVVFNLMLIVVQFARSKPNESNTNAEILRVRALELVDDHGRVRAELKIFPADPKIKMPDGTVGSPEAVMLRMISSQGGPHVKLAATEDGSGLVLGGDTSYVQILSRGANPFVKIVNKDGTERTFKP
jgi:hypothetical protein